MSFSDSAIWISAFMAGLLGSGHCFAMCGGIAGSLGAITASAGKGKAVRSAMDFNLGRLISYAILGGLVAGLISLTEQFAQFRSAGFYLRAITALMVALIGVRFLFNWRGLDVLERLGAKVWKRVFPVALKAGSRPGGAGRFALGMCWGLLPCGLVYTVLLTAASTGNVLNGATTMFVFGLGTLPSMLGLSLAAPGISQLLSDQTFRRFVGLSLLLLACWMAFTLFLSQSGDHTGVHAGHGI